MANQALREYIVTTGEQTMNIDDLVKAGEVSFIGRVEFMDGTTLEDGVTVTYSYSAPEQHAAGRPT